MIRISFESSGPGLSRIWSGTPMMPTSCSRAATSISSRLRSGKPFCNAHAEVLSATRSPCTAVAACFKRKAACRLLAIPSRTWTSWLSVSGPITGGRVLVAADTCSNSFRSEPISDIKAAGSTDGSPAANEPSGRVGGLVLSAMDVCSRTWRISMKS